MISFRPVLIRFAAATMLLGAGLLHAQATGPLHPPTPVIPRPPAPAKPEAPPIPPEQIIQRFAANEDLMMSAAAEYSFEKTVRVEEIGANNKPAGAVEIVTQQAPGTDGKRYEKIVQRTPSTLRFLQMERGDMNFADSAPLFPFTTAQLPKYNITYVGTQQLDELSVYIFSVTPRALDRAHAYFSGVVWVDQQDFVIVKTIGKWVSETGDVTSQALPFTTFEIYREEVDKKKWFPTYSRSDSYYDQGNTHVPIRMITQWSKYTKGALTAPPAADSASSPATPAAAPTSNSPAIAVPPADAPDAPKPRLEP